MAEKETKNTPKQGTAPAAKKDSGSSKDEKPSAKKSAATGVMEKIGAKVLYENSRGEFFTNENYALASEKGDKSKIKTHTE